ncbi:MAG TPA: curli-like amyloid fiber formation chaperone CsgH [Stellaceae bacterium]|nr:curli-like amyloid fiber formation chaperone CsgH [Stellaceae bacterium]
MKSADWRGKVASAAALAAAAIGGANSAAAAPPAEPGAPAGVECRIEATTAGGFLRLQAIGRSAAPASGHYQLSISKRNAGGSTDNRQSGDFTLTPGEDRVLATVMLEAAAEGHYSAQLSLNWNGGSASCHSP